MTFWDNPRIYAMSVYFISVCVISVCAMFVCAMSKYSETYQDIQDTLKTEDSIAFFSVNPFFHGYSC